MYYTFATLFWLLAVLAAGSWILFMAIVAAMGNPESKIVDSLFWMILASAFTLTLLAAVTADFVWPTQCPVGCS